MLPLYCGCRSTNGREPGAGRQTASILPRAQWHRHFPATRREIRGSLLPFYRASYWIETACSNSMPRLPRAPLQLDPAIRGEHAVFMKHLDALKPGIAHQVELEGKRARRILLLNVGEDVVPVGLIRERGQVFAIPAPHQRLDGRRIVRNEIGNPERAAESQRSEYPLEHVGPFRIRAQVMQYGRRDHDVMAV